MTKGLYRLATAAAVLLGFLSSARAGDAAWQHAQFEEATRKAWAERDARLTAPEGWLSLVGLHWLKQGAQTVGTDPGNAIVLRAGPAHLGSFEQGADGQVRFLPAEGLDFTLDGSKPAVAAVYPLIDDSQPGVKSSRIRVGTTSVQLLDRQGRKALRVRDANAPTRTGFRGLERFPVDQGWRIEARWEPFAEARSIQIADVLGNVETNKILGQAVFERDGKQCVLLPVWDGNAEETLFFIFSDETSGADTYYGPRFLDAEPPKDGKVILDFNLAENPPCAFTHYATCPRTPRENVLPIAVRAGEKRYGAESGLK